MLFSIPEFSSKTSMYLIAIDTLKQNLKEGQEGGHQNSRTPFLDHQYLIRAEPKGKK